ncbi:MAG TPA: transporter, partial [Nitrospiraceae bacterium]|nr:transporter [Nitrospiraceae bacterium]
MICKGKYCSVLLVILFLFSGCTKVGPEYVRPEVAVAPQWIESGDERVSDEAADYRNWWHAFNDPVMDRLIDKAYRENLSLRIAGVRVLEARAQLAIAVGELYPQTQQATGSLSYNQASERTVQPFPPFSYWQSQIGVNASWELDFWGKFRRAIES